MAAVLNSTVAINEARPETFPQIVTTGNQLRETSDASLSALKAANAPPSVFVRAGELVRLVADENGQIGRAHV